MQRSVFVSLFAAGLLLAQAPPPAAAPAPAAAKISGDTVVATIEGRKFTFQELISLAGTLGPQAQQGFTKDRKAFLSQLALWLRLAGEGDKNKLGDYSPYKEQLESARLNVMASAYLNEKFNSIPVLADEQVKFYESTKDNYSQVKLKVLYVAFQAAPSPASAGGKKALSEPEAKAKIEKLLADARGGADFVKLIKENSEDPASAAKDGDFGTFKKTDNIPDPIKQVVFSLKKGEISPPVRQPNGFYLFRAEEITARAYAEVKDEVHNQMKQARFKEWLDSVRGSLAVKIENDAFLTSPPPPPPSQPPVRSVK
jgi:peptidyl-prolyl cis-trans isomerase C